MASRVRCPPLQASLERDQSDAQHGQPTQSMQFDANGRIFWCSALKARTMEYAYSTCACSARIAPIHILICSSNSQKDKVCLFDLRLILTNSICTSLSSDVHRSEHWKMVRLLAEGEEIKILYPSFSCAISFRDLWTNTQTNTELEWIVTPCPNKLYSRASPGDEVWKCYFAWTKFWLISASLNPKKKFILNPETREYFSNFGKPCPTVAHCA